MKEELELGNCVAKREEMHLAATFLHTQCTLSSSSQSSENSCAQRNLNKQWKKGLSCERGGREGGKGGCCCCRCRDFASRRKVLAWKKFCSSSFFLVQPSKSFSSPPSPGGAKSLELGRLAVQIPPPCPVVVQTREREAEKWQ